MARGVRIIEGLLPASRPARRRMPHSGPLAAILLSSSRLVTEESIPTREAIAETERRIRPYVRRTPVVVADGADFGLSPGPIVFKLELLQHAGSFKSRGAFAHLLTRELPAAGVVAASGGNHGAA